MTQFAAKPVQQVNTAAEGDQTTPSIALRADGGYAVIWNSGSWSNPTVYRRVFEPSGTSADPDQQVPVVPLPSGAILNGFAAGGVAGLTSGSFVLSTSARWRDSNSEPWSAVYSADIGAFGNDVGATELVDGTGDYDHIVFGGPILATADGGYWVEVRSQSRPTPMIFFTSYLQKFDAAGQPLAPRIEFPELVSVVQMANGNLLAAWERATFESAALSWAVFDPAGELITQLDRPKQTYIWDRGATVAALSDGTGVIVWANAGNAQDNWLLQRVDALGQAIGLPEVLPLSSSARDVQVTGLAHGGFLLSWAFPATSDATTAPLLAQAYDADGNVAGTVMQLDAAVHRGNVLAAPLGFESYDILATPDGGFLLVSEDAEGATGVDVDLQKFVLLPGPPVDVGEAVSVDLAQLYVSLFGRAPDGEGLKFWSDKMAGGWSGAQVADAMFATQPARPYFPDGMSHADIVASFYVNALGRQPDAEGLEFWTQKLEAPGATPGALVDEIANVAAGYMGSDPAGLASQALFNNRVEVARYYGEHNASVAVAVHALDGITADPATVATALGEAEHASDSSLQLVGVMVPGEP